MSWKRPVSATALSSVKDMGRLTTPSNLIQQTGQSTIQLIIPLFVIMIVLLTIALMIPSLSTPKIIGIVAGLVIFIISFVSTEFALYILIFSMLLSPEFIVGMTQGATLGRGVTLRIDDLILLIIGFSWLARMSINKDLGLFLRTPLNGPIALYIIICLISTLLGVLFGRVHLKTGFFFVLKYFEYMIVYFMVVNHLESKKQVRNFLWALLLTCAVVSIIGISQIPGGGRVTAPFEGASGEPNTLGGYLVFMTSVTMGLFLTTSSSRDRLIYVFFLIIFIIPLLYTQSRSSYLAALMVFFSFFLLSEKRIWIAAAILIFLVSMPFISPRVVKERISYTFSQGRERMDVVEIGGIKLDTSTSTRINSWKMAVRDWVKNPFIGYGITGYRFVDAQYIRVLLETGFLGLASFFLLITTIFRRVNGVFKDAKDEFEKGLSMGFIAGFAGLLFHGLGANTFIIVRIMEPFWFVTAMVILISGLKEEASRSEKG